MKMIKNQENNKLNTSKISSRTRRIHSDIGKVREIIKRQLII